MLVAIRLMALLICGICQFVIYVGFIKYNVINEFLKQYQAFGQEPTALLLWIANNDWFGGLLLAVNTLLLVMAFISKHVWSILLFFCNPVFAWCLYAVWWNVVGIYSCNAVLKPKGVIALFGLMLFPKNKPPSPNSQRTYLRLVFVGKNEINRKLFKEKTQY